MVGRIGVLFFLIFTVFGPVHAADVVSPFAGSTLVGTYKTNFDQFHYVVTQGKKNDVKVIEGRIESRVFVKPKQKSTLEVFRSYEKELKAAGFNILAAIGNDKRRVQKFSRQINRDSGNRMSDRKYRKTGKIPPSGTVDYLVTFAQHYIAARKVQGKTEVLVVVMIADRKDAYSVDVVQRAAMETGTVSLSLDALRSQIDSAGRIAIYDILFDTGKAKIRPKSAKALAILARYVKENPGRSFYVVGHTDDQGNIAANMRLSKARAEATVKAVIAKVPAAAARVKPHGVGPLSPVGSNKTNAGRQLNRRVELVLTLK